MAKIDDGTYKNVKQNGKKRIDNNRSNNKNDNIYINKDYKRKVSSYCLPNAEEVDSYVYAVEHIKDDAVRKFIKLILLSGFRGGEILNSYLFRDIDGNVYIRAFACKSKEFALFRTMKNLNELKGNHSRFIGRMQMLNIIKSGKDVFKSVPLTNLFNIDVNELYNMINDDMFNPEVFVAEVLDVYDYNTLFNRLKKEEMQLKIKYRAFSKEASFNMYFNPSFHFYRKWFSAEYVKQNNYNILKTVDFMKWKKFEMILHYVKDY